MTEAAKASGGLRNVAVSESRISSIDGERGILAYRGIDIHALAEHSTFEETAFLLHEGRLPTRAELAAFRRELARERPVPHTAIAVLRTLPRDAHPMTSLRTALTESMIARCSSASPSSLAAWWIHRRPRIPLIIHSAC